MTSLSAGYQHTQKLTFPKSALSHLRANRSARANVASSPGLDIGQVRFPGDGLRGASVRVFAQPVLKPTDAIIKVAASCICGSDLWPFRGLQPVDAPMHVGHEYCGVVVEVGSAVKTVRPGQFVVGSFCLSDDTCPHC